jgi:hypothetical protein
LECGVSGWFGISDDALEINCLFLLKDGVGYVMRRPSKDSEPKALWTCPHCRRRFTHRNQAHSCGRFTVEQLLDGKPPEVVELYDRLAEMLKQCGEVVVAPTKTRVLFKVRTVFATVAVGKGRLDVVLVLGRRLKNRRIKKAQEEYPGIVHFLRIEKQEDLDADLTSWLQEAYEYRKVKDGGTGGEP